MKRIIAAILICTLGASAWGSQSDDLRDADAKGDYATVLRIIRPYAVQGMDWAQAQLGYMYDLGQGVVQDYVEAVKWYRLAAAQGNATAQYNLGTMYELGQGVVQDYAEAVKWYRLAAAQGDAKAQFNLSLKYLLGRGVAQDLVNAYMWASISAARGHKMAAESRNPISKGMTPQQIAEAQKLARECQARQFKGC